MYGESRYGRGVEALFRTERLVIRPWTLEDVDAAYDIYSRADVTRWLDDPGGIGSLDEMRVKVEAWSRPSDDVTFGFWAITEQGTDRPIGSALLRPLPGGEDVEVGWHLNPSVWGRGYATEVGRATAHRAFDTGMEEVFAVVRPGNSRSRAVAERIGMEYVGRTEKYYDLELELYRLRPGDLIQIEAG